MNKFNKNNIQNLNRVLSSTHINFLFGAGVNGNALPQMNKFVKTKTLAEKYLKRKVVNLENDIEDLTEAKKKNVMNTFLKELKEEISKIDNDHADINDISNMFIAINNLVLQTENRNSTMKQVNIYTTNYDSLTDNVLKKLGFLYNSISSSNYSNHDKFFEMIGFDYKKRKYMPTYLISKIHGDIDDPILPSISKYNEALQSKRFEILFNMRGQLSRYNSVLFVIGYSGNDKHINELINSATTFGLTVYWFLYDNDETIPNDLSQNIIFIEQVNNDEKQNSTKTCKEVVESIWQNQLEE